MKPPATGKILIEGAAGAIEAAAFASAPLPLPRNARPERTVRIRASRGAMRPDGTGLPCVRGVFASTSRSA
mgnify:CR=1 FL=1